jgi:O-antigen ligase
MALALLAGGAIAALHGLSDLLGSGGVVVEGVRRVSGPYPHPNALALFLSRAFAFGAAWWVLDRARRPNLGPIVVLCGLALLASYSRGALAAAGLTVLMLAWRFAPRVRLLVAICAALGGCALLVLARERMTDMFSGGSGSLRVEIWRSTVSMIRDRPLQGYGPDQFLYAYLPRYVTPSNWSERFTSHPHNIVLDFWVRLGIIGAAFAVIVACLIGARAIRALRQSQSLEPLAAAGVFGLLALLAHGLVDSGYFRHDLAMSAWLLAWLAFVTPAVSSTEGIDERASAGRWRSRIHRLTPVR